MLRLHVIPDPWGLNPSPFCLKVETYCRLAGIAFTSVPTWPFRAPLGKLPFIDDGGERIPDSGMIIDHLRRQYGDPLDGTLLPEQRAKGHLMRRTCEESLYFVLLHSRWIATSGWQVTQPALFGTLPVFARAPVASIARRGIQRALRSQGYGRHSATAILTLGAADLAALAEVIAQSAFAVDDRPTSYDATLYGVLANILSVPVESTLKAEAQRHASLVAYVERMRSLLAARRSGGSEVHHTLDQPR